MTENEIILKKRQVIQDVIYSILQRNSSGTPLDELEIEGQKINKITKGRYIAVAKSEFTITGNLVFPTISERGYRIGIKYTINRGTTHWIVRMFPKESEEHAKKMNVNLTTHSPISLSSLSSQNTTQSVCCEKCKILPEASILLRKPDLQEKDIPSILGLTPEQYNLASVEDILNLLKEKAKTLSVD